MSGGGFWGGLAEGLNTGQKFMHNARDQESQDLLAQDRQKARGIRDGR